MQVLARYCIRRIGAAIGLLWAGLTLLVAVLQFIAEADDGDFSTVALLALLQIPRLAMETLPFACTIAAAATLQRMEENRELQTMRAAGMSLGRAALFVGGGGLAFAVLFAVVSEFVLEPSESLTRALKNAPSAKGNVWMHHDGSFFYAETIAPDGEARGVAIYAPEGDAMRILAAAAAHEQNGKWRLTDGEESRLTPDGVSTELFASREWDAPPSSVLLAAIRRPREMSLRTLATVADGGGGRFAAAFWRRLSAIFALPLLAACAVGSVGMRRRITMAVLLATGLAGAYYFAAIIFTQFAQLLQIPLLAAAALLVPAVVLAFSVRRRFV